MNYGGKKNDNKKRFDEKQKGRKMFCMSLNVSSLLLLVGWCMNNEPTGVTVCLAHTQRHACCKVEKSVENPTKIETLKSGMLRFYTRSPEQTVWKPEMVVLINKPLLSQCCTPVMGSVYWVLRWSYFSLQIQTESDSCRYPNMHNPLKASQFWLFALSLTKWKKKKKSLKKKTFKAVCQI